MGLDHGCDVAHTMVDTHSCVQLFIKTGRSANDAMAGPADDGFCGPLEGTLGALFYQVDGHHHGHGQCNAGYGQAQLPGMAQEKLPART